MAFNDRLNLQLPESLSVRLQEAYGEFFPRIMDGYQSIRPVTFRVNTCKTTVENVISELTQYGIQTKRAEWIKDALIAVDVREHALEETPLYARGEIYLQSLSSMLPPILLQPKAGEAILDMTAAPGGKTTQLYALSDGKALITACERDSIRFERLKFNLERQGATRVNAMRQDALTLNDFLRFDKILLDAPCTGTGTIARGERIRFSEEYLSKCVRLQKKLFEKAFRLLKKGGTLLYSTCSVLPEENNGIVSFAKQLGANLQPIKISETLPRLPSTEGTVCVCPSELYEGFFMAMFTK